MRQLTRIKLGETPVLVVLEQDAQSASVNEVEPETSKTLKQAVGAVCKAVHESVEAVDAKARPKKVNVTFGLKLSLIALKANQVQAEWALDFAPSAGFEGTVTVAAEWTF